MRKCWKVGGVAELEDLGTAPVLSLVRCEDQGRAQVHVTGAEIALIDPAGQGAIANRGPAKLLPWYGHRRPGNLNPDRIGR